MKKIRLKDGRETIVDDSDFHRLNLYQWKVQDGNTKPYAARYVSSGKMVFMHRIICPVPPGMFVDHINGDGLDNRRANLRPVTKAQNAWNQGLSRNNKVGLKGAYRRPNGRWYSAITVNYKATCLGDFDTAIEAAMAYDAAALRHFGEYAMTNVRMGLLPREG